MDDQTPASPPDAATQSIEDYIATENSRERRGEPSAAQPDATPEPLPAPDPPDPGDDDDQPTAAAPTDRNPDGTFKPKTGKPRHDPHARIGEAIGRQRAAEQRAEEAERRAAAHEAELQRLKAPKVEPPPPVDPSDPEPDPDNLEKYADGQFDRKYLKDQARWEARQELKEAGRYAREQHEAQRYQQQLHEQATTFHERLKPAMADPAFVDQIHPELLNAKPLSALGRHERPTFANFLAQQVFESEHPKELLLHLSDESEVQRLATLPPDRVIRELAKVEARFDAAPAASASKASVSSAKRPIQPLGSSPQHADAPPDDRAPVETHIAYWNAKERAATR